MSGTTSAPRRRQQPAEQMLDDLHALRRVDVAGNEVRDLVQYCLEAFRALAARRLLDAAVRTPRRRPPRPARSRRRGGASAPILNSVSLARCSSPRPREEVAGAAVVLEGLPVGVQRPGRVARLQQIVDGPRRLVCLAEVPREQREDLVARARIELLQGLPDVEVDLSPLRLDQARIGDLLDEAVAEPILGPGRRRLLDDEVEALELGERRYSCSRGTIRSRRASPNVARLRPRVQHLARGGSSRSSRACRAPGRSSGTTRSCALTARTSLPFSCREPRARAGRAAPLRGRTGSCRRGRRGARRPTRRQLSLGPFEASARLASSGSGRSSISR